jgi:hypothetical protein
MLRHDLIYRVTTENEPAHYAATRIFQMEIRRYLVPGRSNAIYNWLLSTTYVPDVMTW